jgi:transposase
MKPAVFDAVRWIRRTGALWRHLPPDYGEGKNARRRFYRWRDRGVRAGLLEAVIVEEDDPTETAVSQQQRANCG